MQLLHQRNRKHSCGFLLRYPTGQLATSLGEVPNSHVLIRSKAMRFLKNEGERAAIEVFGPQPCRLQEIDQISWRTLLNNDCAGEQVA